MSNADRVDSYISRKRKNNSADTRQNSSGSTNSSRVDDYMRRKTAENNPKSTTSGGGYVDYKKYGYQTREAYDADVKKYTWAAQNQGMSYADVLRAKKNATGDELNYLNQYGTLVGYNSLADYDAELANTEHTSKLGVSASNLGKVGIGRIGTVAGGILGGLPGSVVGGILGNQVANKLIDDGSEGNSYYDKLLQSRNLYEAEHKFDDYSSLMNSEDFDANSDYRGSGVKNPGFVMLGASSNSNAFGTEAITDAVKNRLGIVDDKYTSDTYDRLNNKYYDRLDTNPDFQDNAYRYMSDDELKVFNYIYNTQGTVEAQKYLNDMNAKWERIRDDQMQKGISEFADSGFGANALLTGARIAAKPYANISSAMNIVGGAIGGEYDTYNASAMPTNFTDYSEKEVGQNLNDAFNNPQVLGVDVPSFLYSTALSSIDSYIGAATFGSGYSVLMGTGAFQTTAKEMADKGASQQDIWVKAGASGIAEIVTEHVSLESLEKIINDRGLDTAKKVAMAALRQAGYEGSEEVASDIINHMVDEIYNGKASEMNQTIQRYMEEGMTEEEARSKAYQEFYIQMGESFLGGALSGGGAAFVGGTRQYNANNRYGASLRENNNLQYIDEAAQNIDKESQAFKDYSRLVGEGTIADANNAQIATTYRAIGNQLSDELRVSSIKDIENLLSVRGMEAEEAKVASKAIYSLITNKSTSGLSRAEIKSLNDDRVENFIKGVLSGKINVNSETTNKIGNAFDNLGKANNMRTIFQDAERIEPVENGYRIYNSDGTTNVVQSENVDVDESEIMGYVSQYNESAQSIFFDNYRNSTSISAFDSVFGEVYDLGKRGENLTNKEIDNYASVLGSYKIVSDIYKAGNQSASEDAKRSAEAIDKAIEGFKAENFKGGKFKSRVEFKRLNKKKQTLYKYAQGLSALGLNVEVIDDKSAESLNGQYNKATNSITINLSARLTAKDIKGERQKYVINTFAHELTHYLEENAKEAYAPLKNMIKLGLQDVYIGTESVWDTQMKEEYDAAIKDGASHEEALKIAESEVIARACEDVLNDNAQMVDILSKNDSGLLQTIRDAIMKFFEKFKSLINKLMGGFESGAIEAQAVREIDGLLDEMRAAWADAFTQAIAKSQMTEKVEASGGIKVDAETGTVVSDFNSRKKSYASEWQNMKHKVNGKNVNYKSYEECIADVAKTIAEKANQDAKKVEEWIKAEESISAMIMREEYAEFLDYEADDRYQPVKKNSDYPQGTFDLSNLCRKREIFTKMFDALQRDNAKVLFDADDLATIRQVLAEEHYEVACALCYVEDRRQNMGEIANTFIGYYQDALKSKDKLIFKINSEGERVALKPTKDQRDKYHLPDAQYKATDKYIPTQYDLVTYEGFKTLQEEHPTIAYAFERYNNSRGMASARVIEGHAEYARQVLGYTDNQIAKINSLGGLRVFSFSDFEAMHLIDTVQIINDCAKMGIKIQAYTKVPEFAHLVRNTRMKVNRSLIAANVGSKNAYARVIENGKVKYVKVEPYKNGIAKYKGQKVLAFDIVEGIDITSKHFLDESDNPNIGNILVGCNDEQIQIAMTDPFIDYIIPFHTGQRLSVLHTKGIGTWDNYKDIQEDRKIGSEEAETNGKKKKKTKGVNIYDLIKNGNVTNKYEFFDAFIKAAEGKKLIPRFDKFIAKDDNGNYQYTEGYWKMLLDFKLFDAEGNILPQETVVPVHFEEEGHLENLVEEIFAKDVDREKGMRFDKEINQKIKDALKEKHGTLKSAKRSNGTYENKAIKHFGTTENFNVAGYILNDGQMLDFSGAHWLEGYDDAYIRDWKSKNDIRQVDHEDIYEVMEKSGDNRKQFMDRGNIRISPEAPGINISTKAEPTAAQYARIKEFVNSIKDGNRFYLDIEDTKPNKVTYNGKISADRVVNDIRTFFETGVMPKGSEGSLSEYLYSTKRDSEGKTLTKAQEEFFKDSKVRDENGNLMVMYHGTEMGSFDIFEQEDTIANANFFTDNLKVARAYSGSPSIYAPKNFKSVDEFNEFINNDDYRAAYEDGQYVLYLDDEVIETADSLNALYRQYWYASGETDSLNYKTYLNATNPYIVDGKGADWDGLTTSIKGESMTTNEVVEWARENGYDSVIFRNITDNGLYMSSADRNTITSTVVAVMNSDQIKSVNNTNPTSNTDIRYSNKRDSDGNSLTDAQIKFFADSKARDKNGDLQVWYHGTSAEEFNVFKNSFRPNFFTTNETVATSYQNRMFRGNQGGKGRNYKVYINAINPLVIDLKGSDWNGYTPKGAKAYNYLTIKSEWGSKKPYRVSWESDKGAEYVKRYTEGDLLATFGESILDDMRDGHISYDRLILDADLSQVPTNTDEWADYAKNNGYDSIIFKNVKDAGNASAKGIVADSIAVFDSNQIKDVNNTNPTPNADIRYSTKRDAEYMDAVNRGDMVAAQRMVDETAKENGFDSPKLYHGTSNFGFTSIDNSKSDDGISFFLTDSVDVAKTYSYESDVRAVSDFRGIKTQYDVANAEKKVNAAIKKLSKLMGITNAYKITQNSVLKKEDVERKVNAFVEKNSKNSVDGEQLSKAINDVVKAEYTFNNYLDMYEKGSDGIYAFYGKTEDLMVFDAGGSNWNEIFLDDMLNDYNEWYAEKNPESDGVDIVKTRDIALYAKEHGFGGVLIKNVVDNGGKGKSVGVSNVYAFFNGKEDLKSADAITYDAKGNVIPLSERFKSNNADIRYSTKRTTEQILTAENDRLKADIKSLRELVRLQGKETNGFIPTKSTVEAAAKSILKSAVSTYDRASLERDIANAWTKLQKGNDITGDIRTIADNVVNDIKEEREVDKTYKTMLKNLRATRVRLTTNQIAYAKQRYGNRYRDLFMGKVILANDGTSLDALWERWTEKYPDVFQGMAEEDMVDGLLEAYETIKEASEKVVEIDTEYVTNEVMQNITEKMWNIAAYQTVADKYAGKIKEIRAKHRKEMDALKKARDEQKLADEMHYNKLLAQVRAQRDERINSIKEFAKMRKETEKQRAERKRLIGKINRISKNLMDKLLTDSAKKSVPADLKVPVLNLLRAIDFSSQQLLGMRGGENAFKPTKNDISIATAMAQMTEMVNKSVKAQADGGFVIDLPGDYADTVSKINTQVAQIADRVGDSVFVLQEMDAQTLEDIAEMLEVMNTSVNLMNQMIASRNKHSVDGVAREIIDESQMKGKRKNASWKLANATDDFINKEQITPYYFFKHLGSGGTKIFEELQDGFDKYAFHIKSIVDFAEENWTGKQVKEWTKTVKEFDIKEARTDAQVENDEEGRTTHIEMTIPQIMSLYCLNKRDQAQKHIYQKGIKIAEFKNGVKMSGDNKVTLSPEDVEKITSVLTEDQIRVADAIQNHMNTVCKDWMNEITMKRFGIIGALEENYFPIKSDSNALSVEANDTNAQGIYRLLNMSFTKQLNINANNEIVVGDIFTVFTDHATDMAKYNAVALPTLDLIKVLNYNESEKTEGRQIQTLRLRDVLDTAYGKRAVQYINKMLTDLNGGVRAESGSQLITALNRNYKIAAVGANLQVALLQGTSAIRAGYVLDPKYIARGYARRPQVKKVQSECGISTWKQLGFYQINVNRGLEHQIRQDDTVYDKITDASMKGAEFFDNLTWGYLYNACEEWARGETDYAVDSREFRRAVNDKFREVVYATQVVDSTLTRSDYMRKNDWLSKSTSAFMAEPTLTYNMVYDAFNGFVSDIRKGNTTGQALRNNGQKIARAMVTFAIAAALESVLRAGISMLRKPDDDENYAERLRDYFLSELNPLSKIPIFKDILEILQGYSVDRMEYGGLKSAYDAFNAIRKSIMKGEHITYKEVYNTINAASQISGVAASGAMRDVVTLWNTLCRIMGWESLILK